MRQIPLSGRTFEGALAGSTSGENHYVVDRLGPGGAVEPAPAEAIPPSSTEVVDLLREHAERPNDVLVLAALGDALAAAGHPILAARAYGSLVDLAPRAELLRHAAGRLSALGEPGLDLALDAYARAAADRPDQIHGQRLLAFALARQGRAARAFEIVEAALQAELPADRAGPLREILRQDLGVLGTMWIRREPARRAAILARVEKARARLASQASLRVLLSWETDADDLDLHVFDADGREVSAVHPMLPDYAGYLVADAADGHGPEAVVLDAPDAWPYQAKVRLSRRGPGGYSFGLVQFLSHDGEGRLSVVERPFVLLQEGEIAELGPVR